MKAIDWIIVCLLSVATIIGFYGIGYENAQEKYNIDLPEEYQLISHDSTKPDLLIGYYDKQGILHIGFKH